MTDVKVFDDFMNKFQFKEMQDKILSPTFSWNVGNVIRPDSTDIPIKYNIQMTHLFYASPGVMSDALPIIAPLLDNLPMEIFVRAKANTTFASEEIIEHGMHMDIEPYDFAKLCTTAIFYLTNNNGYSKFEDGTKIESVENRLVTFPSTMKHTGTSCTNVNRRVVLNLNYIGKFDA